MIRAAAASSESSGVRRNRRAARTRTITLVICALSAGLQFLSLPLLAGSLGIERFGLWLTLVTILGWGSAIDLGLVSSLTNAVAMSDGREEPQEAAHAVSTAFFLTAGLTGAAVLLLAVLWPWVSWPRVFHVTSAVARAEVGAAVLLGGLFGALRLPLGVCNCVYTAYQEGYLFQLWSGGGAILSTAALLLAIRLHFGLPVLLAVFLGVSLLCESGAAAFLMVWKRPLLRPRIAHIHGPTARHLLAAGLQFWGIQIAALAFFQTDFILVAQLNGAASVAVYGAAAKLYGLLLTVQAAFVGPLWPAYAEALARRDSRWIRQTFTRSLWLSVGTAGAVGLILLCIARPLIRLVLGAALIPPTNLLAALFVTAILAAAGYCLAMLVNGLGQLTWQLSLGLCAGVANILLSIVLDRFLGFAGIAWATAICLLLFDIVGVGAVVFQRLQRLPDGLL